jgi:hypothetical protein
MRYETGCARSSAAAVVGQGAFVAATTNQRQRPTLLMVRVDIVQHGVAVALKFRLWNLISPERRCGNAASGHRGWPIASIRSAPLHHRVPG